MTRWMAPLAMLAAALTGLAMVVGQDRPPPGSKTGKEPDEIRDDPLVPKGTPDPGQAAGVRDLKVLRIPGAAFVNAARANSTGQNLIVIDPDRGYVCGRMGASSEWAVAPAYLPKGAKIQNFLAYLYDNDRNSNITLSMRRVRNLTGVSDPVASVASTGASTTIQTPGNNAITNGEVDDIYSYWVRCRLYSEETRVYAVLIYYDQ